MLFLILCCFGSNVQRGVEYKTFDSCFERLWEESRLSAALGFSESVFDGLLARPGLLRQALWAREMRQGDWRVIQISGWGACGTFVPNR